MDEKKIERINQLTRLSRLRELTEEEQEERAVLRAEYVAAFKASLTGILDNAYIEYPDGTKIKVEHKNKDSSFPH